MQRDARSATPVPTFYNGYLFRSRLEARWAVFFDRLGVKYQYERETWDVDPWYLPDFYLPEQECWVEIKGPTPTAEEKRKASALADTTRQSVYLCHGDPYSVAAYEYAPLSSGGHLYGAEVFEECVLNSHAVIEDVNGYATGWVWDEGATCSIQGITDWWLSPQRNGGIHITLEIPRGKRGPQLRSTIDSGYWCPACKHLILGLFGSGSLARHVSCFRETEGAIRVAEQLYDRAATSARSARFESKSIVYVSGVQGGRVDVARVAAYA